MDYKFAHAFSIYIFIFGESGWLEFYCGPLQSPHADKSFSKVCCMCHSSKKWRDESKMVTHLTGVSFDILGIKWDDQEHLCKEHDICGSVLSTDVVICCGTCSFKFLWMRLIVVWCFWCYWTFLLIVWCFCCHHHQKRWLRVLMQRAQHLQLYLEQWCCYLLAKGAVLNFCGWWWLLFVWCCCYHWCTRHGKNHALCINGIHAKGIKFFVSVMHL